MKHFGQVLAGAMLVAVGLAMLWLFVGIFIEGKSYVCEPNVYVLVTEIIMSMVFVVYGGVRVYGAFKELGPL